MRIRSHLLLMALAILLPIALAAGAALNKIRHEERDAALRGLRETVRATALIVDREVQGSLSAMRALATSPNLDAGDLQAFYPQARAINQPPDVWTLLFDEQGRQVINTAVPFGQPLPGASPLSSQEVAKALASGQPVISDASIGPVTGRLLTIVHLPVTTASGRRYVIAQAFGVTHWKKTALAGETPAGWIVAVIDRTGHFIVRSHKLDELLGKAARPELVQAAAAAHDGLIRHSTVEGIEAYDAFSHSALTGWTVAVAAPVTLIDAAADKTMRLALAGMLVAIGAALLAMAAFGRRFAREIEQAATAALALGRGGAVRTAGPSHIEEVNTLNRALADAGALLQQERQQRQQAQAQREELLRRETLAREQAQAQNVAKDKFLAMLGHELRNPLAAISGAAQLLQMGDLPRERTARYLEIIARQNQHLAHIVNDLLDVSRLLAGKIELERLPLDLAASVASCVDSLAAADGAAHRRIEVDALPVWVRADPVRVEQILNNLIGNAIKFSAADSPVRVTLRREGDRAVLAVRDEGEGIPADLLPHVFEPFVQGPAPAHRVSSGLGIGLALVKQLVELHGGGVSAHSEGPGQGSVFSLWLPATEPARQAGSDGDTGSRTRRKVVLVEDNADARATLAELLRVRGWEVVEVADGESTLPAVLRVRPDVVVLDIGLPDIDGYEVARRLRADPAVRHVPIVALTGYGADDDPAAGSDFDLRLVKPVEAPALVEAIDGLVTSVA